MIVWWIERGETSLAVFGCSALIVCGRYLIRRRYLHLNSYYYYGATLGFVPSANAEVEPGLRRSPAADPWVAIPVGL